MRKLLVIPAIFLLFFSFISIGASVKHTYKPPKEPPIWDKIVNTITNLPFTMVGGKICSTYPDKTEKHSSSFTYTCPSYLSGGCAVDAWGEYNGDWYADYYGEYDLSPGESIDFIGGTLIEVYYCNKDCSCTDYVSQGCGAGPCASDEMYKTRTCEENCDQEEVCVSGLPECKTCSDEDPCDAYGRGTRCSSTGDSILKCYDTDYDGCLEADWTYCSSDEVCENGQCVKEIEPRPEVSIIDMIINILTPPY